jgi:hypothetical protein
MKTREGMKIFASGKILEKYHGGKMWNAKEGGETN